MFPLNLYARVRISMCFLHTRPRVQRAPGIPCSRSLGERFMQASGDQRRENADTHSPVIVREGGRSSIPETSMIEPISRGVLDPPHARGMTAVVVVLRYFTVIASEAKQSILSICREMDCFASLAMTRTYPRAGSQQF